MRCKLNKSQFILAQLEQSAETKIKMKTLESGLIEASDLLCSAFSDGKKLLLCGNGGSAADCQHIATEFVIRLSHDVDRPSLPAIALTTDTSNLTAGGNDIGFDNVFARTLQGLGASGDILIAISTSGNSKNVIKAVEMAKTKNIKTIGFLGGNGGKMKDMVDLALIIPAENVQRIQEGHITIGHIICEIVERSLYPNS